MSEAQINMQDLADSLTVWTGFSSVWSPAVRVKNLRVNGNKVTLRTNATLKDVRWTPENVAELKRKVSIWVLGNEKGAVTIQALNTNIDDLITDCARSAGAKKSSSACHDLTERNIVLYPSHGLYYNHHRDEWIWQRATLWTTVEDLYSHEYVRLVRTMLENAGATIYMPRAGLEQQAPGVSGMPAWTEGARYWIQSQGADSTIWSLYEDDEYKDDMKCRAMWVNALDVPIDLCLALHTDGYDSGNDTTIIGTLVIYTAKDDSGSVVLRNGKDRERVNRNLADWIQTQITNDLRTIAPEWTRRQLKEANYCETRVPVVPSIILELLSHKNMADMRYGLDPAFRFTAARAVYKGILRYINGANAVVQPLPVREMQIDSDLRLSWTPVTDSLESSAVPTYYMVYIRENDGEWNIHQVEEPSFAIEAKQGVRYDCYVVAGNDGGLSMPGPTLSAYLSTDPSPLALIVDGFDDVYGPEWFADSTYAGIMPGSYACEDRFSCAYIGEQWDFTRSHAWLNDDNCGWGACYRDHAGKITIGNTRDYAVMHGRVLQTMNISYVSATAAYAAPDSSFAFVDYICGRNRKPLPPHICHALTRYLSKGGRLLVSADHWDAVDSEWMRKTLHASYYAAHATRSGKVLVTSPIAGRPAHITILTSPNEEQLFTCTPQGLRAEGEGSFRAAEYTDMRCPAAIGYASDSAAVASRTLVFGFPIETAVEFDKLYRRSISFMMNK